jgi:hypothetical protein
MARRRDYLIAAGAAVAAGRTIRKDSVARILSRVRSTALRRGVRSNSPGWLYLGASLEGLQVLRRFTARKPEIVRIELRPGEGIDIREIPRAK